MSSETEFRPGQGKFVHVVHLPLPYILVTCEVSPIVLQTMLMCPSCKCLSSCRLAVVLWPVTSSWVMVTWFVLVHTGFFSGVLTWCFNECIFIGPWQPAASGLQDPQISAAMFSQVCPFLLHPRLSNMFVAIYSFSYSQITEVASLS